MLDEDGGEVRVQNWVCVLREDQVHSVRARLNRLCSGHGTLISNGRREHVKRGKNVRVFCECRAESVDSADFPTGSVQREVYTAGCERVPYSRGKGTIRVCLSSPSRWRSLEEGSSEVSGMTLVAREGDAEGEGDSASGVTSFCT